jgi:hypothetical protein
MIYQGIFINIQRSGASKRKYSCGKFEFHFKIGTNLSDLHSRDIQEVPTRHHGCPAELAFSKDGDSLTSSWRDCSIKRLGVRGQVGSELAL